MIVRRARRSSDGFADGASVLVLGGDAESADGVAFEVDLDQHGGLAAGNPGVVPRSDVDHRRCHVGDLAAVRELIYSD